jgi:hypothetical protein
MAMYHDNPRRSVNPDFEPVRLTREVCRERARAFCAAHGCGAPEGGGIAWTMRDLRNYGTPPGYYLPEDVDFNGPGTITAIAAFLRANLRRH